MINLTEERMGDVIVAIGKLIVELKEAQGQIKQLIDTVDFQEQKLAALRDILKINVDAVDECQSNINILDMNGKKVQEVLKKHEEIMLGIVQLGEKQEEEINSLTQLFTNKTTLTPVEAVLEELKQQKDELESVLGQIETLCKEQW